MHDATTIQCPYCWQPNEIEIDIYGGDVQRHVEDCRVCCRPWQLTVDLRDGEPVVTVEQA